MKRILLSVTLLFTVCALATAQHKMKFGVTVQAGNYRQAHQGNQASDYLISRSRLSGGILAGLGVYAERALCRHVALYSGLNYFQSTFTDEFNSVYPDQEKRQSGSGTYAQTGQFTVRQITLPVQLQLRAGANRSISFSVGAAPSFTVTKLRADPITDILSTPPPAYYFAELVTVAVGTILKTLPSFKYFSRLVCTTGPMPKMRSVSNFGWRPKRKRTLTPCTTSMATLRTRTDITRCIACKSPSGTAGNSVQRGVECLAGFSY